MENKNFNPAIEAVTSIRHLAFGISNKWSVMKTTGKKLEKELTQLSTLVNQFGNVDTNQQWESEKNKYQYNLNELKRILSFSIDKIQQKTADGLTDTWNSYIEFSDGITQNLAIMKSIGKAVLPENEVELWEERWSSIENAHQQIKNEAAACSLQLQLIENSQPGEIDELTDTILKHIPLKYSVEEAEEYHQEYMEAYEAIKKEASQKKSLWDRFLDVLAGGAQQTPAQRVMMQRWVNGEKGDNSL